MSRLLPFAVPVVLLLLSSISSGQELTFEIEYIVYDCSEDVETFNQLQPAVLGGLENFEERQGVALRLREKGKISTAVRSAQLVSVGRPLMQEMSYGKASFKLWVEVKERQAEDRHPVEWGLTWSIPPKVGPDIGWEMTAQGPQEQIYVLGETKAVVSSSSHDRNRGTRIVEIMYSTLRDGRPSNKDVRRFLHGDWDMFAPAPNDQAAQAN